MPPIPVYLLKTRSQPTDAYEAYFSQLSLSTPCNNINTASPATDDDRQSPPSPDFIPHFLPVLTHTPNTANLSHISDLLRTNTLTDHYGGVIFTSQRAVEGFASIIHDLDRLLPPQTPTLPAPTTLPPRPSPHNPFPLYAVGPATSTLLTTLLSSPTLRPLHPVVLGAHTGTGEKLASFILNHYNTLHRYLWFEYYEAPRLPFIPLVGPASGQYARQRMEAEDKRLRKKELLFLVGETRRDVIPRMLGGVEGERRVGVEEVEVYRTEVEVGFEGVMGEVVSEGERAGVQVGVVVVFSPQGCEALLRSLGWLGVDGRVERGKVEGRWMEEGWQGGGTRWVVVTIGPTTRDYLRETFGFEVDICARKPSPEGVGEGVRAFLKEKGLLLSST